MTPLPVPPETFDGPNFGVGLAALIVSVLALGIGGYSLVWQIVRHYRWDRPRLTVTGTWGRSWDQRSDGAVDNDAWMLEIEVTNTGDVGTQIIDVYWEFSGERGPLRVSGSGDPGQLGMRMDWRGATEQGVLDPPVPIRLEPFSRLYWLFNVPAGHTSLSQVSKYERGRAAVTWVSRVPQEDPPFGEHPNVRTSYGPWQTFSADHPARGGGAPAEGLTPSH
jgi:hypothetical protein